MPTKWCKSVLRYEYTAFICACINICICLCIKLSR